MKKAFPAYVLCICLAAASGCANSGSSRSGEHPAAPAVRDGVDRFLRAAMTGEYEGIAELIVPSERRGFNPAVFIENRFRMPVGRFEIFAWDRTLIKVIDLKEGPGVLSTVPVSIRALADNKLKPVYVNLHWRKVGGRWLIKPYPQQ